MERSRGDRGHRRRALFGRGARGVQTAVLRESRTRRESVASQVRGLRFEGKRRTLRRRSNLEPRTSNLVKLLLGLLILAVACQRAGSPTDSAGAALGSGAPVVANARIGTPRAPGKEGEWTMPARDYANSRYSELREITAANAKNLKVAWTFSTGVLRGHEGQPLVIDNTMYIVTPYPNVAYALDLTQPGFPLKWKFRPDNAQAAAGIACCDAVNRGAAYADGRLVYNLLDGHTVAVDAATGHQLWRTKMADLNRGETITMAPIIVKKRVLVGSSGGEMGVRGWIAALDLV